MEYQIYFVNLELDYTVHIHVSSNFHNFWVTAHFKKKLICSFYHVNIYTFTNFTSVNNCICRHFSVQFFELNYLFNHLSILFES